MSIFLAIKVQKQVNKNQHTETKKVKKTILIQSLLLIIFSGFAKAQLPPVFEKDRSVQTTETVKKYLSPTKIMWQTQDTDTNIINANRFLLPGNGQADLSNSNMCILKSSNTVHPALLLDFGRELHVDCRLLQECIKAASR